MVEILRKPVEILIHNVSHRDLVLSICRSEHSSDESCWRKARPKFSSFSPISMATHSLLQVDGLCTDNLLDAPLTGHQSTPLCVGISVPASQVDSATGGPSEAPTVCAGLRVPVAQRVQYTQGRQACAHGLRAEDLLFQAPLPPMRDSQPAAAAAAGSPSSSTLGKDSDDGLLIIRAVFFPLIAALVPKWLEVSYDKTCHQRIYLISGCSAPRDPHDEMSDNSTEATARLIKLFLGLLYPPLEVVLLHSPLDILKYDENISFVHSQLRPHMERHRRDAALNFGDQWPHCLRTTVTLADGAAARISAINAFLREFRPCVLHMWELKRFWSEGAVSFADVQFHEFETMETRPALPVREATPDVQRLVKEMLRHKARFDQVRNDRSSTDELSQFWLRKTKKVVLAMLMAKVAGNEEPLFFPGMNIEVSMPTGTLCSERNAIGSALAAFPSLRRQDMKMIAVLSVPLAPNTSNQYSIEPSPSLSTDGFELARTAVGATPLLPTTSSSAGHDSPSPAAKRARVGGSCSSGASNLNTRGAAKSPLGSGSSPARRPALRYVYTF